MEHLLLLEDALAGAAGPFGEQLHHPYVVLGLVRSWTIRSWDVVIG
jgi:hypothetical protein